MDDVLRGRVGVADDLREILGQVRHQDLLHVRAVLEELAEHGGVATVEGAELGVVRVKAV
jgi:hypothetical protein